MAQTNVSSQQRQEGGTSVQRRSGEQGISRRDWGPVSEFFSNPFSMMRRVQDEMDRNLARFFGGDAGTSGGAWFPAVEVTEHDGQFEVHTELPGLKPEDVQVEITDDSLVIHGERKFQHEERKGGAYRSERRYGRFYREIPLPEGANAEQAKARFQDGVLEVTLPVPQESSRRRSVPVQAGSPGNPGQPHTGAQSASASPQTASSEKNPKAA